MLKMLIIRMVFMVLMIFMISITSVADMCALAIREEVPGVEPSGIPWLAGVAFFQLALVIKELLDVKVLLVDEVLKLHLVKKLFLFLLGEGFLILVVVYGRVHELLKVVKIACTERPRNLLLLVLDLFLFGLPRRSFHIADLLLEYFG